jgi:soluble lytic murein transglycosylase-like protein
MRLLAGLSAIAAATGLGFGVSETRSPAVVAAAAVVPERTAVPPQQAASCPVPERFRGAFVAAAADARLPVALLAAMAHVESRFQAGARSPKGAVGLLQVMPATARVLGLDVSRPSANVLAGARFMRAMLDRFRSADVALAAYNAGPAAVERAGGAPSAETLRYVIDVNARWRAHVGCSL